MRKSIIFSAILMLVVLVPFRANSATIQILNPNISGWYSYQEEIKLCTLFVQPKGVFTQFDLEMSVSADSYQNTGDSLEILYNFNIPQNATINDSWLWVGDTIVKAMLIDRSKASQIYEGLVSRRTDPSILTYNSDGSCVLRVYPLFKGSFRKFRISFLIPNQWTNNSITA